MSEATVSNLMSAKAPVSIIIPIYNEANGVTPTLTELFDVLESLEVEHEVIAVDDGSSDGTSETLAKIEHDKLRVIVHTENRGYGAAIKTGMAQAQHPWIMITDADGTYPNAHIPAILEERASHCMVVGARRGEISQIPLIRRPPKWVLRKLASVLSRKDIPDLNSGLRVMRKDIVQRYENILPNRFSFTSTITLAMISAGHPVKYLPINYLHREGSSKIRPIADTLGFLVLIIRTIMYFDPLRIFLPAAALCLLAAASVGIGSYSAGQLMDVSTLVLFSTGVQLLAIGMLADAINRRIR